MYYQAGDENNIQAAAGNNIQTLYLMNPSSNYIQGYTDTQQQVQHHQQQQQSSSNMIFLNGHALHTASISHAPLQQAQHFVGVPLPSDQGLIHRLWGGNGSHHHSQVPPSSSTVVSASTTDLASQLGFGQRPMPLSPQQQQQQGARGLSLSLSPHQQQVSFNNISSSSTHHQNQVGGLDGISNMILGSKYLKVAQELLDEVVNVGNNKEKVGMNNNNESMTNLASDVNTTTISGGESSKQKNGVVELTTAQRQEFQMKKVKLVTMLEEVEQRYRQYHHQMQIIVSSFEQVAGIGSAKSYTQLAIHAISKQFRCLKDAIIKQIKATSKNLGEEDQEGLKIEGSSSSRLKFVDHHLRQQRALQQLGMMQPNAWRPQRGLPERAVSVLRAWLFEHFLHPYPKDSDKIMLAKQTGLTRSQVSNWFINARVRLWKPMVEEMYIEEVKNNQDQPNNTSSQENKNQNDQDQSNKEIMVTSNKPTTPREISTSPNGFSFINNDEKNTKKPRNHHDMQNMNNSPSSIVSIEESNKGLLLNNNNPLMAAAAYNTMGDHFGRFNNDPMATNFLGNNLTLGLPHPSDHHHHQTLALQGNTTTHQQNYISNHQNISFEDIDFQNGKRFSTQLLPDFVT